MELRTDIEKLSFLLEAEAELADFLADGELSAQAADRPKYITNYIGSKQKLVDWIWSNTPDGVETVADMFSGSSVVGYMYKSKGLAVVANDRLHYCHHIARAIVENDGEVLTDDEVEALLAENQRAGDFVRKTFGGLYFAEGVHGIIDAIRANADRFQGFKKDIALFALGKTCITGKGGFGHFGTTKSHGDRQDSPDQFRERFARNCRTIGGLVFKNEKPCRALNEDILEVLPKAKADLAYFDPPYATHFSQTNYEKAYHFIEGLMTYWEGKEIIAENKTKSYRTDHKGVTKTNAAQFFTDFLSVATHIPHWIISYRDQAYPSEAEMQRIIAGTGKKSRMKSRDHHYQIGAKHGEASHAKEHLFLCAPADDTTAEAASNPQLNLFAEQTVAIWEETENEIRYRVRDPEDFQSDTFRRKTLDGVEGVSIIIGKLKSDRVPEGGNPDSMVVQAYRFSKKSWSMEEAKQWVEKHKADFSLEAADWSEEELAAFGDTVPDACCLHSTAYPDLDFLTALAAPDGKVKVTSYMGNKYFILDFIWKHTPKDAASVLDAFSGGANVAYFFKQKGLQVTANDKLHYPFHIARAVIENSSETLSDEEIEALCRPNPDARTFVVDTFYGYFFTKPILAFLDSAWTTAQKLQGYKKDLALFVIGYTCVQKARFGEFSRTKKTMRGKLADESKLDTSLGNIPLSEFVEAFRRNCLKANSLVFDNGKPCKATNVEALDAVASAEADFIYADPPYITQFGANDYEAKLHFVEGLMTMWEGKELRDNARRDYASGTKYNRESMTKLFEEMIASAQRPLLISYRDKAYPTEDEVKGMLRKRFGQVAVKGIDVEYGIAKWAREDGGKKARELLFIGAELLKSQAAFAPNIHTRVTGTLSIDSLSADAAKEDGKTFRFVLTHVGTNRNGDHFLPDELRQAAPTAIGRKIDLAHSQEFRDIVGGIVDSEYVEDGDKSRVEGTGELFTDDSEPARLAYKLMKRGMVSHVSMECDYQEGECSICGKKVKSKAEYCTHLKNSKGKSIQGKPVFEVLHGIAFTGMGLLDREGADAGAEIRQVAFVNQGGTSMADKEKDKKKAQDEFDSGSSVERQGQDPGVTDDKDALVKKLQDENARLKKELEAAQQQIEELQAAQQAAQRQARAEKLLKEWENRGRAFEDEEARTAELGRLAALTDEAFSATETVIQTLAKPKDEDAPKPGEKPEPDGKPKKKQPGKIKSDAGVRPAAIEDRNLSLGERLGSGLMAAYKHRSTRNTQTMED